MYRGTTLNGYANQSLEKNDYLLSPSHRYQLILQDDGNLVIYDRDGHSATWASDTNGQAVSHAVMQSDGNFVIYGFPNPIWATDTDGSGNAYVTLQDDGNLVIYKVA